VPTTYEWYELVEAAAPLEQGDFLDGCPAFIPNYASIAWDQLPAQGAEIHLRGRVLKYNVIVLSQSCDLADGDLDNVVVCPHWDLEQMYATGFKRDRIPYVQKGYMPAYHMLQACNLQPKTQSVHIVDFGQAYSMPYEYLRQFVHDHGERLRLNPPYREHLSQAYARYFMRVGLPQGITLDKPAKK